MVTCGQRPKLLVLSIAAVCPCPNSRSFSAFSTRPAVPSPMPHIFKGKSWPVSETAPAQGQRAHSTASRALVMGRRNGALVHRKATGIERHSRFRSKPRHHARLVHLEGGYAQLAFRIVHHDHHFVELDGNLYPFIHGIRFLKDRTGEDRPSTIAAPLLRENPVFPGRPTSCR
jgi:hypothetical protein